LASSAEATVSPARPVITRPSNSKSIFFEPSVRTPSAIRRGDRAALMACRSPYRWRDLRYVAELRAIGDSPPHETTTRDASRAGWSARTRRRRRLPCLHQRRDDARSHHHRSEIRLRRAYRSAGKGFSACCVLPRQCAHGKGPVPGSSTVRPSAKRARSMWVVRG